jgi:hypothetical protein
MLLLTIGLTAGTISAVVVGDHVLEIERPRIHMVFLYAVMLALVFAVVTAEATGALG